jgi:hypothetical protein
MNVICKDCGQPINDHQCPAMSAVGSSELLGAAAREALEWVLKSDAISSIKGARIRETLVEVWGQEAHDELLALSKKRPAPSR